MWKPRGPHRHPKPNQGHRGITGGISGPAVLRSDGATAARQAQTCRHQRGSEVLPPRCIPLFGPASASEADVSALCAILLDVAVELDYAFLAHWARVNADGTLTAVDASFLRVAVPPETLLPLAIAGRVRFIDEPYSAELVIEFQGAGINMAYSATIKADEGSSYGDRRRHALFALTTQIPVVGPGEYSVNVSLDGKLVRELIFTTVDPVVPVDPVEH